MTRKVPSHSCLTEHEASRSYQPSSTGIAAYYQAEQSGGLAVCPPLPRVPSTHHLHGEGPAEEVSNTYFTMFSFFFGYRFLSRSSRGSYL